MRARYRIDEDTSLEEVAALVCTTLEPQDISVVLSGGAMESLGFEKRQRHWTHPRSGYWVAFRPGPVAVGEETIRSFAERETRTGILRLLAPTECVMARQAW